MVQRFRTAVTAFAQRHGPVRRGRIIGLGLALLAEALLVLLILTLGTSIGQHEPKNRALAVVDFKAAPQRQKAATSEEEAPVVRRAEPRPTNAPADIEPEPSVPEPQVQTRPEPPLIPLSRSEMRAADISALPRRSEARGAVNRPAMGPPDTGPALSDTPRVGGSGPNGEPLYAASWYREPYDNELSGYLSTATGPGWGLIACRTAPNFRVEDCVKIDEYPAGSNIARAVLAAAWQFQVRPPRVGGQPRIGEWVRIRIDYDLRRR